MAESSTRTVDRALDLLAAICENDRLGLAAAAREANLPASTALRLLRTLESKGFVDRDEDGEFRPGGRLIQLGARAFSQETLVDLARKPMRNLAQATGESVYLSVEGHLGFALYIGIVEGSHSVRHANWVGRTIPLEGSAAGEVLAGGVPEDGYVVRYSGVEEDVAAISAPIQQKGRVVAAMSLLIPSYRTTPESVRESGEQLVEAASEVSEALVRR